MVEVSIEFERTSHDPLQRAYWFFDFGVGANSTVAVRLGVHVAVTALELQGSNRLMLRLSSAGSTFVKVDSDTFD